MCAIDRRLVVLGAAILVSACGPSGSGGCPWCVDGASGPWPDARPLVDGLTSDTLDNCGTAAFPVSETAVSYLVPANVTYLHAKLWGAGGNQEDNDCVDLLTGGLGGYSEAVFDVTPGQPLVIIVGKRGRKGMSGEDTVRFGFGHWGGGGLSGIFTGTDPITETSYDRALIIAGGGGSAGWPSCTRGGSGNHTDPAIAGGMPTMLGGAGADEFNGGGGGYRGGLGGGTDQASRGGTSYVSPSAIDSRLLFVEPGSEYPPNRDDPQYDGTAGMLETSGLVVLNFTCTVPPIQ